MKKFIIEGSIGDGKTTLLELLSKNEKYETIKEPVDKWISIKDDDGINLLDHFYKDMNKTSYMFQSMVFVTRLQAISKPQEKEIRFSERSIMTDKHVFGRACVDNNNMTSIQKVCYNYWYDWLSSEFAEKPNGIIYLRSTPEKCLERIKKRGRVEEATIPLEYLKQLNQYHDEWLLNEKDIPICIIDNNKDYNWDNVLKQIEEFIKTTN